MAPIIEAAAPGVPIVNPLWDAAQAALALATECLGDGCSEYPRTLVETSMPAVDCATLAVVIGSARARSGNCAGKIQLSTTLDIFLARCCDPVGSLDSQGGYTPPSAEEIEAAAACIVRDAWAIYNCIICDACATLGAVKGVTACCDDFTGPPEIRFGAPSGACRSATVSIPIVVTACCEPVIP